VADVLGDLSLTPIRIHQSTGPRRDKLPHGWMCCMMWCLGPMVSMVELQQSCSFLPSAPQQETSESNSASESRFTTLLEYTAHPSSPGPG
jgi:hypothetical protein